nr:MAG TPA: antirepressor protein [Caudoviricetes sp.]
MKNLGGANNSNSPKMSSREIAELAGKRHDNVMRDIRNMEPAWEKVNALRFELVEYTDSKGEKRPEYQLDKREVLYVATKWNDETRAKLILRWEELEKKQLQKSLPGTFAEALRAYADEVERNEKLKGEIEVKNVLIAEYEPKVTYYDQILASTDTITVTQIAKDYGMTAQELNKLLHENKIQFKQSGQWILYKEYAKLGYTKSHTTPITYKDGRKGDQLHTRWTQKGRLFLYELLKQKGHLPLIEQEDNN